MKMEGRNRSGGHSSGVVKNRSSSGCLIIKKKADGVSGVGSSKKEKKRPRMNVAESFSSDDEFIELYPKRGVPGRSQVMGSSVSYENDDFEDMVFGRNGRMREVVPKGRELDVYDFDEYDELSDVEMMRMRHYHDHLQEFMPGLKNGSRLESESGSSKGDIIYKRRNSFHGGSSIGKNKGADLYSGKRRFEMRNDVSVSMGKEKFGGSDDAIRLQGKNGVLKVRVKHKEDTSEQLTPNYIHVKGNRVAPRSQALTSKNVFIRSSPSLEKNVSKRQMPVDRLDKSQQRKRKLSVESSEESEEEAEDNDSPLKPQSNSVQVHRSTKRGRSSGNAQSPQGAQTIKMKEGKVKRGSGTEKQLLREKIRTMLINAGWTIDYRPRRGRDYFDAVYVNPSGTAYWSIIKAYDALQKQLEEEGKSLKASEDSSSFAPISDDVLSKLTRQTRKKIEKELKRKKKEEVGGKRKKQSGSGYFNEHESDTYSGGSGKHDDKLSSFMKHRYGNNSNNKMPQRGEKSSFIHARNSKKIGRCMLLVRNSGKGSDSETDGFIPYTGKRNLLSWLIDCGTVKLSEKVHYMNRKCTRVMLEGWITREGIHCGCCSKILTVPKFELHAASKLRQPYQNIYLSSGTSLMQCQIEAWNRQEESLRNGYNKIDVDGDDPNDDTCAMCGDGGNLICCDSCPSTFHQTCLGIEMLPPGDWHCPHCSCKFCGLADMSPDEGNDRKQAPVLMCCLCEGKFHPLCVEEMDGTMMNSSSPSFCGKTCQELSERLEKLLGVKHELEGGLVWSLIHRVDIGSDSSVRGFPQRVEWNSKLAVTLNVMDECFLPINDRRSGINMIHSVLYNSGSNFTRLNYGSFYTAILEKGDEIVAAASIRIHGTEFAEMPFIGTRHIYRRQGMCRQLFSGIESALRSLKVEKLIIPAISELMDTWTNVFGFNTLKESDKQKMKVRNMLVFPGTDMLQKKLYVKDSVKKGSAGASSFENGPSESKNYLPNASEDCKEVEHCNDNKSTQSEDMKVKSASDPLPDCHEEVIPHSNDNKPPSQAVINEANLVVSNGECKGITSSELQSVAEFDKSGVDRKDQISVLDNYDTKCNKEVSFDENLIHEANIAVSECGPPPKDDKMVDTSSNGVLNGLSESKDESLPDPSHISVETEKPLIESPAKHDFHPPSETKVDEDSHIMPPENDGSCSQSSLLSGNINIDSPHEPKLDVSKNTVCSPSSSPVIEAMVVDDVACKSLQNPSDSIVAIEKPQNAPPIFEGKVDHVEVSNDQRISDLSHDKCASTVIPDTHESEVSLSMSTNGDVQPITESELNNHGSV